jgi:hypothetical protein
MKNEEQESLKKNTEAVAGQPQLNVKEIECFLLEEIEIEKQDTFMYQLHYEGFFNEAKLNDLLNNFERYLTIHNQKTEKKREICIGVFNLFFHTFYLFYCHNTKEDLYKIRNYEQINIDTIPDYYLKMKLLISKCI